MQRPPSTSPVSCARRGPVLCETEFSDRIGPGSSQVRCFFRDHYDWDVAVAPFSASAMHKQSLISAIMRGMPKSANEEDTPPVAAVLPSHVDVCKNPNRCVSALREIPGYTPNSIVGVIEQTVVQAGVPLVSLHARFNRADSCDLYFRFPDNYWNAVGQAAAADLTAGALFQLSLVR